MPFKYIKNIKHHHDGVWICWLPEYGYIVFNPDLKNLCVFSEDDDCNELISLWVEKTQGYKLIEINYAWTAFSLNPKHLDNYQVRRIARKYWHWRCGKHTKAEFLEIQEEQKLFQLKDE